MKSFVKISFALFSASLAIVSFTIAAIGFKTINFITTDALGDAREAKGDGPLTSWWHDFFAEGWFVSYLPLFLFILIGIWLSAVSISTIKLLRKAQQTEQGAAANP